MEKTGMIYGTRAVIEAIVAGRNIDKVMIQTGLSNDLVKELQALAKQSHIPVVHVPQEKLKRLSSRNHQGVVCLLSPISFASLDNLIYQCYQAGGDPFFLVLDRITDVRNFGAMVRTAECVGVTGIIIPEKGNAPISGDAMKTSAGALNHVPVCREKDLRKTLRTLHENGIRAIACTEKTEKSHFEADLKGPIALVLGNEEDGISEPLLRDVDELVRIPLLGKIGSLNVSVAAGIALYEVVRQRSS